jgi:hypothetical protein
MWARLFSYMVWPNDEQQRKAFIAQPFVKGLSSLEHKGTASLDSLAEYQILHENSCRSPDGPRSLYHRSRLISVHYTLQRLSYTSSAARREKGA